MLSAGSRRRGGARVSCATLKAAEENAQWPRVAADVLRGLDQHPARLAVASLGDRPMLGVLGRLPGARLQAEIARGVIAVGEAAEIAERRQRGLRAQHIHSWQRDQQFDPRVSTSESEQRLVQLADGVLQPLQQMQVAAERGAAVSIDLQLIQPLPRAPTE
jgi:hypothetical protein